MNITETGITKNRVKRRLRKCGNSSEVSDDESEEKNINKKDTSSDEVSKMRIQNITNNHESESDSEENEDIDMDIESSNNNTILESNSSKLKLDNSNFNSSKMQIDENSPECKEVFV
ncbi:hypothetical protein RclHR1_04030008 [Rhizophagus clarus]|uniref:Uncharacterized protein n=1 Tax=Rhizophagus clarus TaxID=94130 RepID=A0A2Z6RIR7_9GLOM|nr:hypothetical protein RclHR1_04030008 [Rhizophagus clarus]GES85230.1 hypothetical protein GLOIN_2v1464982 [Rhizophagus clarus]